MGKPLTFVFIVMIFIVSGVCNAQKLPTTRAIPADAPRVLYIKTIQDHVNNHWTYKKTLDNQFYSVQVELMLNKDGYATEMKILKLSSDDNFNDSVFKALAEMEPYPPIPDNLDADKMEVQFYLMPNS
jgi:outer membrane biosynthesis protein TonB